jgi:hypothetical protein
MYCMAIIYWSSQLIQVKRRKAKGSVLRYEINQKALGFFPAPADSTADTRPYVTLVTEM